MMAYSALNSGSDLPKIVIESGREAADDQPTDACGQHDQN